MTKQEWAAELKALAESQRQINPIPVRDSLSDEEEWQRRIIGGEFIGWRRYHLQDILDQRTTLRWMKFDPEPLIVFTTAMPGLVAAQDIIGEPVANIIYLLHATFEKWAKDHPVDDFNFHIHHWSYFRKADSGLLAWLQQAYPEIPEQEFRVHTTGELWSEQCGFESKHLWRWNGHEMELLQKAFSHAQF